MSIVSFMNRIDHNCLEHFNLYIILNSSLVVKALGYKPEVQVLNIQLFIIYVPSEQLQGQLQTQHSLGTRIIIVINNIQK
jgi:hypothetical protein